MLSNRPYMHDTARGGQGGGGGRGHALTGIDPVLPDEDGLN